MQDSFFGLHTNPWELEIVVGITKKNYVIINRETALA